ncbi:HAMP domain-containing protein [Acidaminobacter sp. JC074]|uniref:ATP-binding protein n=1 Tax=Acidaminobacter sp. JC074 TaxID=2530199 RepID=UPI001F0D54AA|nr:ATP-binding protein [Acidaminobacter sp. JC074]MCH4890903.1 HAMP domain-containing protein [Acidaminobacter sp. JC074]
MSKNFINYMFMGFTKNKSAKNKKIRDEENEKRAKAFDQAFSDKTYSVAKKVLDNVEKVADYDYDALFDRVNKVIDNKMPKMTRTLTPEERAKRSKEFDEKIESKVKNFNIDDYLNNQNNYKNSIIEKTKKNIQKKYEEADQRHSDKKNKLDDTSESMDQLSSFDQVQTITPEEKDIELDFVEKTFESAHENESLSHTELDSTIEDINTGDLLEDIETISIDQDDSKPSQENIEEDDLNDSVEVMPILEEVEIDPVEVTLDPSKENFTHEDHEILEDPKSSKKDVNPTSHSYTKDEIHKSKKYYKSRKRMKFGKQMKIELEDSIIGQQKKSIKRLFRFSLSFKLSFVFMVLIILTVVSLSVAFYLGIDYVLVLQEQGKIEDIQFFRDVLIVLLIIFDMAAILICVSFGTKASRELVSPINEMTQIVQEINANDMDRRLNVTGIHDELKELATTFNEMLDRIENSYETQNRFTSDASHELRTPISVIQGYINMLDRWGKADGAILDESIEAIKSESKNMKRLTEKLLLLAKADKGILELEFKPFALNDLIDEITKETIMIDSNHTVTNRINDVKTITADRESLKQAIRIFVDNAVKYTPDGGTIYINSFIMKNKIYIEIEDNGIGISKEDMANIFNRFYRVDKSRSKESGGHGLGLSIAKWIVNQHKGELEVKSELDKGTIITLILSPIKE